MAKENFIIENDDWDTPDTRPKTAQMRNSNLPEGLEIIETVTPQQEIAKEIHDAAVSEGERTV